MGESASAAQAARARARTRMVELERERLERRRRVEDAATTVFLAIARRASAEAALVEAEREIGAALRAILAEGADVDRAAMLCDRRCCVD